MFGYLLFIFSDNLIRLIVRVTLTKNNRTYQNKQDNRYDAQSLTLGVRRC